MENKILPCIVCGKVCESAAMQAPDEPLHYMNHPYGGTVFTTRGHYGSTAFDPMDNSFLEITVCDDCLRVNKDRVIEGTPQLVSTPYVYKDWGG